MPHRYQVFEKFAFSLVVLFAVMCSGYITWESSPSFRDNVHQGRELLRKSGEYQYDYTSSYACTSTQLAAGPCAQFAIQ
jgi:hypothetical protein